MTGLPDQMLAAVLHGLDDAVLRVDAVGTVVGANGPACVLLGVDERALLGAPLTSLLTPLAAVGAGAGVSERRAARRSDGTVIELDVVVTEMADGSALVLRAPRVEDALPPRLRETLQALLEGDGEKQVAARLGLSPHTVHIHVKRLYQRFGVRSRGELLALFVQAQGVTRTTWRVKPK